MGTVTHATGVQRLSVPSLNRRTSGPTRYNRFDRLAVPSERVTVLLVSLAGDENNWERSSAADQTATGERARDEVVLDQSGDIYAKLLGLPTGRRPPDYYALLGLKPNESDEARIHRAARRQIARLSNLLASDQAEAAQQLMAEIATARAVLTTPARRERYDAKLRAEPDFVARPVTAAASNADGLLPPSAANGVATQAPQNLPPAPPTQEPASSADAAPATPRWANPVEAPPRPPDSPVAAPTTAKALGRGSRRGVQRRAAHPRG